MRNRRNHRTLFVTHLRRENHEWGIVSGFEVLRRGLLLEGGSEGAPPLTEFYRVVHLGIHFRVARIGNNRAATECARPELHSSLEPAKNSPYCKEFSGGRRRVGELRVADFVRSQ